MIDELMINELIENLAMTRFEGKTDTSIFPHFLDENLVRFVSVCNGGYSKDFYFHFFGTSENFAHDIKVWNSTDLWKKYYGEIILNFYFFAEDIFGNQFGYNIKNPEEGIYLFWVDDGKFEVFANDFEEFIEFTIFDYDIFGKMRELKETFCNGSPQKFSLFHHISYKKPLLLGGNSEDIKNLEFAESISHLRLLGQVVKQSRSFQQGTKIKDVIIDDNSEIITLIPE